MILNGFQKNHFSKYVCGTRDPPPLSQTPKNSFKRWPSPRNDLVVSNKLFQGPFIPLLWILFGQTGYPIKFFTYKWKSTDFPFLSYFRHQIQPLSSIWGHFLTFQRVCSIEFRKYYEKTLEMSSQLFVTWFDVAGHQHLKKRILAPWLLPWIYPWDLPCISYSLLIPWVLPCWHPWVLPCHLDTLGVQCTLNILVPLIYQQLRSGFIIAALTPLLSPTVPSCLLVLCPPTICNLLKFRPVPPSFVDHGPKLRVLLLAKWKCFEMAKNRGESRKWPIAWKRNSFWGWSEWESCSP